MSYFHANQSLSHGTMRNEDLLDTLGSALERAVNHANGGDGRSSLSHATLKHHADLASEAIAIVEDGAADSEAASEIVAELFDALDKHAPAGCSFGAHEGDGSDYGFWSHADDDDDADGE